MSLSDRRESGGHGFPRTAAAGKTNGVLLQAPPHIREET